MLVVQNRHPVNEGREEEFEALFEERTQLASQQIGFESLHLLRAEERSEYVIQAYWESEAAFENWRSSDLFVRAHEDISEDLFAGPNQLSVYEVTDSIAANRPA